MEILNSPISKTPQLLSSLSSFTPRIPIKTSNNNPLHRLHKLPSFPPPRRTDVFHVSAHFGRKTSRRNSLRKKLTDPQKVRQIPTPLNPVTDIQNPNDTIENFENLNSGSTKQSDVDNDVGELKSKRLGESILLSKLENWVDQYKKDAEFWGIGSGPVLTVSQDVEGNVKGVTVHEDEILKRLEFEDTEKTSSVAKFVVPGEESGFVSGIRGVILYPGFIPKLSSLGTFLFGGLIILWASKLFVSGKKEAEYTQLEKEMVRRKIRSRKGREILEKGSVEVVQASVESPSVPFQRPRLDKQELMNNILKARAATDKLPLLDSSGSQSSKSQDLRWHVFLSNLSIEEDSVQAKGSHKSVESISSNEPNGGGVKFLNGVASPDSRVRQVTDASSGISSEDSESTASVNACESAIQGIKIPCLIRKMMKMQRKCSSTTLYSSQESIGKSGEQRRSAKTENWIENNFHEVEPVLKKIGDGFRENYMVARERTGELLNVHAEIKELGSNEDEDELEWMKDDRLRDIVFQVRENELSGRDPFYLMDAEEKLAFFQGLEKKMVSACMIHQKIIPRWKGPPLENPEFLNNFQEQRKALFNGKVGMTNPTKGDGQSFLQKLTVTDEDLASSSELDLKRRFHGVDKKDPKIIIESSDGSFKPGKKSGKEFWQHTKKWSRGFLESYNAETDPEVKSIMKDMGKDLDRWITEKEIQEAADLMKKIPERNKKFIEKKLNKLKREMELFGPQAVVSKYQEYQKTRKKIIYGGSHGNAWKRQSLYCSTTPKDAFREAKANGFGVTVIRKRELRLNVDQTLEEVEEEICEIGSKMYHDKIMRERSVDISS
ncbi:Detected protein of confused Function [Hibiscus syriacus]|uniref:Detected protein of confused Function n=1 Tax=Hibiscus syriacus TaxID=106335 RepID=A0A6A3CXQ0_HIBSY|nr:Detected protein of confused Function [Hibiscus syriacus]